MGASDSLRCISIIIMVQKASRYRISMSTVLGMIVTVLSLVIQISVKATAWLPSYYYMIFPS
jgi:hypothetical protein